MRRILVLRGGALGDFLVTLPALARLRARWPGATIELAGNAVAAALAVNRGLLTAVHAQHERRWSALYGSGPLPAEFAAWLASFDLILCYWPDPDGDLSRRLPLHPGQRFLTASALPRRAPAAIHYATPLAELGLAPPDELIWPLAPRQQPAAAGGRIYLHPGSGSPRKNWPPDRWQTLLREVGLPATVVLGEAEAASWTCAEPPGIARLENASLEELVTHFQSCRLFLGHDSGISHLAAACGAPCLLLFGPTDPAMWAPPAARVRIIRRGSELDSISVAEVRQALAEMLAVPA